MTKKTVGGLDNKITKKTKNVTEEEINDVTGTVHTEISEDFQKNKEAIEKIPELEDANFRIDSTNRTKEIVDPRGVKVKENLEGDIREYLEGDYKGEQLFTGDEIVNGKIIKEGSATRESKKAGKKLPASWTTYRDIINKKYEGNYQDFLQGEKMIFTGWRYPFTKEFCDINKVFDLRCADGSYFNGDRNKWNGYKGYGSYCGFSIRCLKSV